MIVTFDWLVDVNDIRPKKILNVYKICPGPKGIHCWYKYGGRDCDKFLRFSGVDNVRVYEEVL